MGSEFMKWIKVHVLSSFACNGEKGRSSNSTRNRNL